MNFINFFIVDLEFLLSKCDFPSFKAINFEKYSTVYSFSKRSLPFLELMIVSNQSQKLYVTLNSER
jgi:hypothetical protein